MARQSDMFHADALETEKAHFMGVTLQYQTIIAPSGRDEELPQKLLALEAQPNVFNDRYDRVNSRVAICQRGLKSEVEVYLWAQTCTIAADERCQDLIAQ